MYNTEKEKILFGPQDHFYKTLAVNCVDAGICIDLFLFPNNYIDVATIGIGTMIEYLFIQIDISIKVIDSSNFLKVCFRR